MIFSAFQREDDDAVFTVGRNVSGGSFSAGQSCAWDVSSSVDGVRVSVPATATLSLFRGVFAETVADSGYGKIQVGGYNSYASVLASTLTEIAPGDILKAVNGQKYLQRHGASDGVSGFVFAAETVASSGSPAAAAVKVLLRAL